MYYNVGSSYEFVMWSYHSVGSVSVLINKKDETVKNAAKLAWFYVNYIMIKIKFTKLVSLQSSAISDSSVNLS